MKVKLILGGILLLCLAMAFNLMFSWSALDQFHRDSSLSRLSMAGLELETHLKASLPPEIQIKNESSSFSDSLKHSGGSAPLVGGEVGMGRIRGLIEQTLAALLGQCPPGPDSTPMDDPAQRPSNLSLTVVWTDGSVICGNDDSGQEGRKPASHCDISWLRGKDPKDERISLTSDGKTTIALPVREARGRTIAYILMGFPEHFISRGLETAKYQNLFAALLVTLVGCTFLGLMLRNAVENDLDLRKAQKKRISLIIFLVTASAQLAASGLNMSVHARSAWNNLKAESEMTSLRLEQSLVRDCEQTVLRDAYGTIDETMARSPQFTQIRLLDHNGRLIHAAGREAKKLPGDGWVEELKEVGRTLLDLNIQHQSTREIRAGDQFAGRISIIFDSSFIYGKLLKVIADALTVTVISLLFLVELMVLFFELLIKKVSVEKGSRSDRPEIMRPAAFLFVFGIDISVSFLPLHMKNLYEPILGLSKDFILGLPISVEFICVGLAILLAGVWVDRRGWYEPFLIGLTLAGGGVVYSWLAPSSVHFILSRAIAGAGYGLSLMASQGFVIRYSDKKCKAHGLAQLFAGIYAGSICGSATGAMLAERFGYASVFAAGAFIILSTLVYTVVFMRGYMLKPLHAPTVTINRKARKGSTLLAFMFDRTVISLIFFSSLPAAIGVVGFLNYFSPVYLSSIGASQSTIGRILMIYGISLIYLGPYISRYVDASTDKRIYVFTGCILGSMSFLVFYFFQGIWAAVPAVLLLGLSSSFVLASQSAYVLQLPVTHALGEGKAIGIFRSSSRIGQALGPMVFGAVMARGSINDGIALFGLMYLMTAVLFMFMNLRTSKPAVLGEVGGV
jgi:predicted MFS family arabinose efflux permease